MNEIPTAAEIAEAEAKIADMAVGFLERTTNAWMKIGLPLPVLARAMIGMGTSCLEGSQGHAVAADAIDMVRNQLAEHQLTPARVN